MKKILIILLISFSFSSLYASTDDEVKAFTDFLTNKCGITNYSDYMNSTDSNFDGYYKAGIGNCENFNDNDFNTLKVLKKIDYLALYGKNKNITITNLNGLKNIVYIGYGSFSYLDNLTDISGLNNLQVVNGSFAFQYNSQLQINGLNNLITINGTLFLNNNGFSTINGFNNLTYIKNDLILKHNGSLTDLSNSFNNLKTIGGYLDLTYDWNLLSLNGFNNLETIGKGLTIVNVNKLTNLHGLENLKNLSGIVKIYNKYNTNTIDISALNGITNSNVSTFYWLIDQRAENKLKKDNPICHSISKFYEYHLSIWYNNITEYSTLSSNLNQSLRYICGDTDGIDNDNWKAFKNVYYGKCKNLPRYEKYINIENGNYDDTIKCSNTDLTNEDLDTFKVLKGINSSLYLYNNPNLTNLNGLQNLKTIGGSLDLHYDRNLINLSGLENLETIGNGLYLQQMYNLLSLHGLENLKNLSGIVKLYTYYDNTILDISALNNVTNSNVENIYFQINKRIENKLKKDNSICHSINSMFTYNNMADTTYYKTNSPKIQYLRYICGDDDGIDDINIKNFKDLYYSKCGASPIQEKFFNVDNNDLVTFEDSINCSKKDLTNEDLDKFKIFKAIDISLYLDQNKFTNLDGLNNLNYVGNNLDLHYNNNLTNIEGLDNLVMVGGKLSLNSNYNLQTVNGEELEGLHNLSYVNYLDLSNNKIINIYGLNIFNNITINTLDLHNCNYLKSLNGLPPSFYIKTLNILHTLSLTNISAIIGNRQNFDISVYFDKYKTFDNINIDGLGMSGFCYINNYKTNYSFYYYDSSSINSTLKKTNDDLTSYICGDKSLWYLETKTFLLEKAGISNSEFDKNFNITTGIYVGNIDLSNQNLTNDDLTKLKAINKIDGNLILDNNNITDLDNLRNIKITNLSINNNNISNLSSLDNLKLSDGTTLQLTKANYSVKLDEDSNICNGSLNINLIDENGDFLDKYYICEGMAIPDGIYCDDNNSNTVNETFLNGICQGGVFVGSSCDDGNSDTTNDIIYADGSCKGVSISKGFLLFVSHNKNDNDFIQLLKKSNISISNLKDLKNIKTELINVYKTNDKSNEKVFNNILTNFTPIEIKNSVKNILNNNTIDDNNISIINND